MGGSKPTERRLRQNHQRHDADPENDRLEKLHRELQKGCELPQAMDDIVREDHHELLLKFDGLKEKSTAQEQEIAFYRDILLETSSNEVIHHMQNIQHQLRQLSVDFDLFTRENSRTLHENNRRSQHKFSLRDNLDRATRTLLLVEEENRALRQSLCSKEDSPTEAESDEFGTPADEALSGASTIRKKKGRTDLKSQGVEGRALHLNRSNDHFVKSQEQPDDGLLAQISALRADFVALQSKLQSAETHIVNIGGNLGSLLPREVVKDEYNSLVGAIKIWITTSVLPVISSTEQCFQASERTRNIWLRDAAPGITRVRNQDFRTASEYPGADESILLVMIFDLLIEYIFSTKALYGDDGLQRELDVIKQLESSMRINSGSSKNVYNSRRWMSEAVTACLDREETEALRQDFSHALADLIVQAMGLTAILGPNNQNALDAATISIRQEVVLPAIQLGDRMACAIDKYSLDGPSYWSEPCVFQTEFFRDLGNLDCKNLGEGPPRFRLEKMQARLSDDEIKSQLTAICPAIPALILTEVGDNTCGPPTILVNQQVWVSWHPEKRKKTPRSGKNGYFWFLYHQDASTGKV